MFLHTKITLYFNLERHKLCLQAFWMRVIIYFGPHRQDDAITWKKSSQRDKTPHLHKQDLGCEKHPA